MLLPEMTSRAVTVVPPIVLFGRPVLDDHADVVGQGLRAGRVGADVVARDDVAGRPRVGDIHAVAAVARDHVTGAGRGPADGVVARAGVDSHAAGRCPGPQCRWRSMPMKSPSTTLPLVPPSTM